MADCRRRDMIFVIHTRGCALASLQCCCKLRMGHVHVVCTGMLVQMHACNWVFSVWALGENCGKQLYKSFKNIELTCTKTLNKNYKNSAEINLHKSFIRSWLAMPRDTCSRYLRKNHFWVGFMSSFRLLLLTTSNRNNIVDRNIVCRAEKQIK